MWSKQGLILSPQKNLKWMQSHAMLPTVEHIQGDDYRVYFSGRNEDNVSLIGHAIIRVNNGEIKTISYNSEPILSPGERGCFDDNGVTPSCIVEDKLYYIGWNSGTTTYRMSLIMGLALKEQGIFRRHSRAPLMKKTDREPFGICTAPFVIKDKDIYKMWYVSGEGWIHRDLPKYNIKYAHSLDGIEWHRDGKVAVDLLDGETALARPCVVKTEQEYEMYFSYKVPEIGYRIGLAKSSDGIVWNRTNQVVLDVSEEGWDSEMVQYSYVFRHNDIDYMLYNGNGYGKTGIGYAIRK